MVRGLALRCVPAGDGRVRKPQREEDYNNIVRRGRESDSATRCQLGVAVPIFDVTINHPLRKKFRSDIDRFLFSILRRLATGRRSIFCPEPRVQSASGQRYSRVVTQNMIPLRLVSLSDKVRNIVS